MRGGYGVSAHSYSDRYLALEGNTDLRPSGYEPDELPDCSTPRRGRDGPWTGGMRAEKVAAKRLQYAAMSGKDWRWCHAG
jgi:hypothetical protein